MGDEPPYDLLRTYTGEDDSKRTDRVVWPRGLGTESHPVQSVHVDDVLSIPEVDDLTNAFEGDGNVVWVTGAGADTQGVYQWDGSSWVQLAGSGGGKTEEEIEDIVDGLITVSGPLTKTYDDPGNTLNLGSATELTQSEHDSLDHSSALSSTFSPSTGDHIAWDGSSWTTEQPPSTSSGSGDSPYVVATDESTFNTHVTNGEDTILVDGTVTLTSTVDMSGMPDDYRIVGVNGGTFEWNGSTSETRMFVLDDTTGFRWEGLNFTDQAGAGLDYFHFEASGVLPYGWQFIDCYYDCSDGNMAFFSDVQPWGGLVDACKFLFLDNGLNNHHTFSSGDLSYVRMGGVNNIFSNCQFGHVPDGSYAVSPAASVAGAESWLFENCTFGGFFSSNGGAVQGKQQSSTDLETNSISPLYLSNCSFEGLTQNGTGNVLVAGRWTECRNGWFRENNASTQVFMSFSGFVNCRLVNNRFDEGLSGLIIDASNAAQSFVTGRVYVEPLGQIRSGADPPIDDPAGVITGHDMAASGTVSPPAGGSSTVTLPSYVDGAALEVSYNLDGTDATVDYDIGHDGTDPTVVFTEEDGSNSPTVSYRVFARSPWQA